MRIGCSVGLDKIEIVQKAGYDYIEPAVGSLLLGHPESEFEALVASMDRYAIRPEAWNCLMPGGMKLTGPSVDFYGMERYLRTAFFRIAKLGGEVVVFASGAARNIPEDFDDTKARAQIREFITLCGAVASQHSLTVVISPLTRKESNIINNLTEAVEFAKIANRPEVKVIADLHYMNEELEPLSHVVEAGSYLGHSHTADTGRYPPGNGSYDQAGFIRAMKEAGYDKRVTVACRWNDFDSELAPALQYIRGVLESVNSGS